MNITRRAILVVLTIASPLILGAIGASIGSQYTYQAAVFYVTTPQINSYVEIKTVTYAAEAGILGGAIGFGFWFIVILWGKHHGWGETD